MNIGKCYYFSTILVLVILLSPIRSVSAIELSKEERAYLHEKNTIVFVSQTRYPPFEFVDKNGEHTGMCIELARWMATELGFTARFVDSSFQEAQKAVLSGKADVLTSLFYSKKRAELFNFTQVMFEVPASIFVVVERTDIKDLSDLDGKVVAMQSGDYAKEYLESKNISADVVYTKNFADAIDLVIAGKADAVIGDEQIVLYHIFKNRLIEKVKRVGDPLYIGQNCMATKESNQVLINILKKGITLAKKNGTFEKINRKWIGTCYALRESPLFTYLPHILASVGVVFILLLLVWFWNIRLRHVVSERTEALRESEEKFRLISEQSLLAIGIIQDGRIKYANEIYSKITGYPLEDIYGWEPYGYARTVYKDDLPLVMKQSRKKQAGDTDVISNYQFRGFTKAKEIVWWDIYSRTTAYHGRFADLFTLVDITERVKSEKDRKALQAQLQRAEKMEAIGTLAGGVAHDLNNILGGIVSYPELLLLQLPGDSPLRKSILTIQKSGEKASAVVQDLLTLARRGVVSSEVVNMNTVISEYFESAAHINLLFHYPGVHIESHLEKDVINIVGSSTHLSKTVMNLIFNAAEAMPEGGQLTVSTENRYIDRPVRGYDNVKEGDYVVLTISDTGTGISLDDIGKIFEPFYTKKKMGRSGTGLGMAVVWGTVKDHNGYIDVQSTEGEGTTFILYFPGTREKLPEDKSHLAMEAYTGSGESILIVDDVEEQRKIASGMLKELGYSTVSVASGEEAVDYLKTHKIDLLVLDMIMDPGMDGLDTYKKILEMHPGQKAIIASGFSESDRVKKVQSMGAGAYIRKPLLIEKIGIAVKEELEK